MKNFSRPSSSNEFADYSIRPQHLLLEIAAKVIAKANRELPADSVLRAELKSQRGLSREEGRRISESVFAYYRWMAGTVDVSRPEISARISKGIGLAEKFLKTSDAFSDEELWAKAIPDWIKNEM
ncbi:MAG: hypothetical protein ACR2H1_10440, partial [Limisphaerales bacterium]